MRYTQIKIIVAFNVPRASKSVHCPKIVNYYPDEAIRSPIVTAADVIR